MSHAVATGKPTDRWYRDTRLGGLRRFAAAITIFNILGHTVFGFEQSWAQPLVGLATAYSMELLLELCDCAVTGRRPRFLAGGLQWVDFFLPAQITGLAVSMLLYSNDRLMPIALAAAVAIGSKHLFRVQLGGASRHFLNPSNFGITTVLLLFPWVGIAPPYHFTENLTGWGDWFVPAFIIVSGSFLNTRFTRRLPLIAAWLLAFVAEAGLRHLFLGTQLTAALMPMTGVAFILYTFYMVTDPPTTPGTTKGQIAFGISVAATYGILMVSHVVFGLFFALTIVSTIRGSYLYVASRNARSVQQQAPQQPAAAQSPHSKQPQAQPIAAARGSKV